MGFGSYDESEQEQEQEDDGIDGEDYTQATKELYSDGTEDGEFQTEDDDLENMAKHL